MKNIITKIFLLFFLIINTVIAQFEPQTELICIEGSSKTAYAGQLGGYILPSEGTVNVFIVFVQFPDDNYDTSNPYWVKGQAPENMNSWVNQTWSSNPIQGSMTHYFNEMSFNKLKFTGKTVSVITPQTRQWYLNNNKRRGDIHKEVIQQLDQTWNFAEFDNWDLLAPYEHDNNPDEIVEMIIMVWRNIGKDYPENHQDSIYQKLNMQYSYGDLGGPQYEFTVDNGARTIKTGFWPSGSTPGGSGVTITDFLLKKNLVTPIHEFAHYLLGGNEYHVGYGFWGMLEAWGKKSKVANSFERYRLGWINVNEVNNTPNQTISNATLSDYVTTGVSYKLNINPATHEYFFIENHQKLSYWEQVHNFGTYGNPHVFGTIENGLYVLRQDGYFGSNVQIIPADGRFGWTVNQRIANPYGSNPALLPVFKNLGADRVNGYHDLNLIPWTWNGINQTPHAIHFTENSNGQPVEDIRYPGDGKDAFRQSHNEIFSPWSNPNSHKANRTATPFGFKINNLINDVYTIDIYVNTALNAPPSKPQDFTVSIYNTGGNAHPKLNWQLNVEPDVNSATQAYLIERSINGGAYTQIATVNGSTSEFIDYGVSYAGGGPNTASYKIRAKDTQGLTSLFTDVKSVPWGDAWKIAAEQEVVITEYGLQQNYPNPFNPVTQINYQVKANGFVELKVYDILGNEITALVNEVKSEGYYSVQFDAGNLPSGVYIYSLRVNDFIQNQKMTLMK
jgi:M6 family metalloprotease-like protein